MHEIDRNTDEIRRQLRETQRAHDAALSGFGAALDEVFDPDGPATGHDRAAVLGLPDRRGFLKIGGLTIALSALAAACVEPDRQNGQLAQTGTVIPAPSTSVPPNPGSPDMDATLVLTALSIERLAIDVYQKLLDGHQVQGVDADLVKYFQDQHRAHADLLVTTAKQLGQSSTTVDAVKGNAKIDKDVISPLRDTIAGDGGDAEKARSDTLKLAQAVEDTAAQTYTKAGGILTTARLRQSMLSIGAIEAKHYSVLAGAMGGRPVPFAFEHTNGGATADDYVKPTDKVIPAPGSSTGTTVAGSTGSGSSTTSQPAGTGD
jgi:rubrerythrin